MTEYAIGFCSGCGIVRDSNPTELESCPCVLVSRWGHAEACSMVSAAKCPISVPCEHGFDVCYECTPCTCGVIERRAALCPGLRVRARTDLVQRKAGEDPIEISKGMLGTVSYAARGEAVGVLWDGRKDEVAVVFRSLEPASASVEGAGDGI